METVEGDEREVQKVHSGVHVVFVLRHMCRVGHEGMWRQTYRLKDEPTQGPEVLQRQEAQFLLQCLPVLNLKGDVARTLGAAEQKNKAPCQLGLVR